jgi:ketosteroid isomerase-like protein
VSEQRLEMVRAFFDSGTLDLDVIMATLEEFVPAIFTEDVEFVETPERVDSRTYQGHAGVIEAFRRFFEQWDAYSAELVEVEDHDDKVFVAVREEARGKGSGAPVSSVNYVVVEFRGEKLCRYFESYDEAVTRRELDRDD